jgi:4-nitrophenyl phosphatase
MAARASQVMTSSYGCARYIEEKYGKGKKVFVVGEQGLRDELETEAGATILEGEGAGIVVVGLDRHLTYQKLGFALKNLNNGAAFVLANTDPTLPTEHGLLPGTGSIAALLIYASGRTPDAVIGKPSTYLMERLLEMHRIKPKDAAFVGDRLDIDIRMANKLGMKSVLVLTGIASEDDLETAEDSDKPDMVLKSAAEVGKALKIY